MNDWRPISEAKKDGTPVLIALKKVLPGQDKRPDLKSWAGLQFVAMHHGLAKDGFDIGWMFAAPVGQGGFPDDWIAGFKPLGKHPEDMPQSIGQTEADMVSYVEPPCEADCALFDGGCGQPGCFWYPTITIGK